MIAKSGFGLLALFSLIGHLLGGQRRSRPGIYEGATEADWLD